MAKEEKWYRDLISRAQQYTQLSYPYSSENIGRANVIKTLINEVSDLREENRMLRYVLGKNCDTFAKYSLINVSKENGGLVNGVWLQDFTGTFRDAVQAARDIEKANGNRITVAVVEKFSCASPDYSPKYGLKRLDVEI